MNGASKSAGTKVSTTTTEGKDSGTKVVNSVSVKNGTQYQEVNAFISGSFGKVQMGTHNGAAETHGADSTYVGNGPWNSTDIGLTDSDNVDGITYSSPSFNGISAAYSMSPAKHSLKSWGVKYSGKISGINATVAYGTQTPKGEGKKTDNSWGIKISSGAFYGSFAKGNNKAETGADTKHTRIGVAYSAGKISVGYSQDTAKKTGASDVKRTLISGSYKVASGLSAFVEQYKKASTKTTLVGTKISF